MKNSIFSSRISTLQQTIPSHEYWLLSDTASISYFTGFAFHAEIEREALLLLTKTTAILFHSSFLPSPKTTAFSSYPSVAIKEVTSHLKEKAVLKYQPLTLFAYELTALQKTKVSCKPLNAEPIWNLRMSKEKQEIKNVSTACQITSKVLKKLLEQLETGITEIELAEKLELAFKQAGAAGLAFPSVVCFGENTALPHHIPTDKKLQTEMAVLVDCGAKFAGYCADMTRSFWFGKKPPAKYQKILKATQDAYSAAVTKCIAGTPIATVHSVAKKSVENQGLPYASFPVQKPDGSSATAAHTTGHGLGLDIHEPPRIFDTNQEKLKANMIITIEPGIYFPGEFGVRYENTVLITEDGCEELTG